MKNSTIFLSVIKYIFPILVLFLCSPAINSQPADIQALIEEEEWLSHKFEDLYALEKDQDKEALNLHILDSIATILASPGSFQYPFDSLKRIGRVYSPDRKFRIITWNIPRSDGTHKYYGFIQLYQKKKKPCRIFNLFDHSEDILRPETASLSPSNWFGSLYYDILLNKHARQRYYTLLAFDYNDFYSNKKIIEVLTFDKEDNPSFGKTLFQSGKTFKNRVIFEFAPDVVMTLRYNPDLDMIVFDHLSPIEPALQGNPKFYAPDSSYDGYKFRKGIWEFQPDIDVRNK